MTDPTDLLPPATGVAETGQVPDPWAAEKAVLVAALQAFLAKLNESATRDQIVTEVYFILDALPIPGPVVAVLDAAKPIVTKLAELGAK